MEIRTLIKKLWQNAADDNQEAVKVIDKWIDSHRRKKEIEAQKAREKAAKDEELPPQFIVGNFDTALISYRTHDELVKGSGTLQ